MIKATRLPRVIVHIIVRAYQLSFSSLVGRQCRHLPTCSSYVDEAVSRHGFWAGGWMGLARICRCHPWGTHGFDPVPAVITRGDWRRPWLYGRWRGPLEDDESRLQNGERPFASPDHDSPAIL